MPISFNNSPVLTFESRWSAQRYVVTLGQFLICLGIPWIVDISIVFRFLLGVSAITALSIGLVQVGWWGAQRVVSVTWQQSGDWILGRLSTNEPALYWKLQASSFVTPWLMILRWRCETDSASLIIFRGEMTVSEWRRWRSRLRLQASWNAKTENTLQSPTTKL